MRRIHIIGGKNHGKTTLVAQLVQALTHRGLRIGTIKHTHHHHELDSPGKDSHRHRQSGAVSAGILSPGLSALFWPVSSDVEKDERYAQFELLQSSCDLVLVEGDVHTRADRIEVWRAAAGGAPLAAADPTILGVVTDDPLPLPFPTFSRHPPDELIEWIFKRCAAG
jgi:molybdopterin-guanine dinucleotide biosynthesis protein B